MDIAGWMPLPTCPSSLRRTSHCENVHGVENVVDDVRGVDDVHGVHNVRGVDDVVPGLPLHG